LLQGGAVSAEAADMNGNKYDSAGKQYDSQIDLGTDDTEIIVKGKE